MIKFAIVLFNPRDVLRAQSYRSRTDGTARSLGGLQAINCLATIIQSLRDK